MNNILNDVKAEQAILGCMLFNNDSIDVVSIRLTAEDFHTPVNRMIYESMLKLRKRGRSVDLITLGNLNIKTDYMVHIADIVPTDAALDHYIEIVYSNSIKRKIMKSLYDSINLVKDGNDGIMDIKTKVLEMLDIPINLSVNETNMPKLLERTKKSIELRKTKDNDLPKYGFRWLDQATGGIRNGLTYLAARPSIGKTAFSLNIALNLLKQNKKVTMFNLEMDDEAIIERMISAHSQIKYEKILRPWTMDEKDSIAFEQKTNDLNEYDFKVYDNVMSIEKMKSILQQQKLKNGLDYVIIDYIQLCETKQKSNSTNERISHISRQIKLMQKELKVPFLVLSQLSREQEKNNRPPKLIDLRDSGSLEQDADSVWFLYDKSAGEYNQEKTDTAEIDLIIAKQRSGRRDIFTQLHYYKSTQKFFEKTPF